MDSKVVLVKNMVCQRCVSAVEDLLRREMIGFEKVNFGEIYLAGDMVDGGKERLRLGLEGLGFEMIESNVGGIIEKVKQLVIRRARNEVEGEGGKIKLSVFLSEEVHHEYTYLSSLFSSVEGRTIENYFIEQRIEKAKELLVYGELSLLEIAGALEYSSAAHLSAQFKKVTGLTPGYFREVGAEKRKGLDDI